jgi:hypothetical protein
VVSFNTEKEQHFVHRTDIHCLYLIAEQTANTSIKAGLYKGREPLMVAQWLRYCATNRKVTGSIPDGVTGIFH